ncbi:hypothetical protein ACIXOK_09580 [Bacteroides fragilis]
MNSLVLGNIYKDSLIDIVNKEMLDNTAWRKYEMIILVVTAFTNGCVLRPLIMNWLLENRTSVM